MRLCFRYVVKIRVKVSNCDVRFYPERLADVAFSPKVKGSGTWNFRFKTLVVLLFVFLMGGGVPSALSPAVAHDVVINSVPQNGSIEPSLPRHFELEFSGAPQGNFNTVALTREGNPHILFTGKPTVDGRMLSFDIPEDVEDIPGKYLIGFQITSSDGHATRGSIGFQVGAAEGSSTGDSGVSNTATSGGSNTGELLLPMKLGIGFIGILAMASVLVMFVARSRNRK